MNQSAVKQAVTYLHEVIEKAKTESLTRLPTAREMAALAGVSHPVMLKAVAESVAQGALESRRGRGIILARAINSPTRAALVRNRKRAKWRTLAVQIERDIQDGVHPAAAPLPPVKNLAADYGAGFRTVTQALATLVRHGSIQRYKRGYVVRDLDAIHYRSSIVLITRGDRQGDITATTPRMHEHLRAVERECSQHNLRLIVFTYDYDDFYLYPTEKWRELVESADLLASVLGFIVWPIAMRASGLEGLVQRLARLEKPISVLDEGNGTRLPPVPYEISPTKLFAMAANPSSTRAVGRYLLALGHKEVVFLSPFESALWSQNRLRGLRQAYRVAGLDDAVHGIAADQFKTVRSHDTSSALHGAFTQLTESLVASGTETDSRLARALHVLRYRIGSLMQDQVEREELTNLFGRALLEAPEATAWVGANDYVAIEALDFLHQKAITVPSDISVVGLDDGLEAHLRNLTSYNFNGDAVIRAMVGHIVDPFRVSPKVRSTEAVEIEGFVVVRKTTARATMAQSPTS